MKKTHYIWTAEDGTSTHYRFWHGRSYCRLEYYHQDAQEWMVSEYASLSELKRDARTTKGIRLIQVTFREDI